LAGAALSPRRSKLRLYSPFRRNVACNASLTAHQLREGERLSAMPISNS
jgi:hypothetical protein